MATCEACGNDYDKAFQVVMTTKRARSIVSSAQFCTGADVQHCGTRIVGHGPEKDGAYYCCDHCAQKEGVTNLRDRV